MKNILLLILAVSIFGCGYTKEEADEYCAYKEYNKAVQGFGPEGKTEKELLAEVYQSQRRLSMEFEHYRNTECNKQLDEFKVEMKKFVEVNKIPMTPDTGKALEGMLRATCPTYSIQTLNPCANPRYPGCFNDSIIQGGSL